MSEQVDVQLQQIVEGLIFAADEPITPLQIKELVEGDIPEAGVTPHIIKEIVDTLNEEYSRTGKPYSILSIAGGYQFATNREVSLYVGKLHREQARRRLTQAALETLSIIAYKQPVTKSDIETIRGVNCDYILRSLLEKDLITVTGREQAPGRPLLYGTTRRFLQHFGLNSLTELPKPREIEELIGETELEVEKRLIEMERERQESEEEDMQRKRDRKPHPISKGAMAKIIPLNPDYRPERKSPTRKPDAGDLHIAEEKETDLNKDEILHEVGGGDRDESSDVSQPAEETGAAVDRTDGESEEEAISDRYTGEEIETPVSEIATEPSASGERQPEPPEEQHVTPEEKPLPILKTIDSGDISPEQGEKKETGEENKVRQVVEREQPRTGWKKWKNKIVRFIKKIFG
jgi:segregation and condensation protein B